MKLIIPNIFVGKVNELYTLTDKKEIYQVNLSSVYHKFLMAWEKKPSQTDPNYVIYEGDDIISLNWVDGPAKYFDFEGKGLQRVQRIMDFIERALLADKKVLIVCDQAQSRSPSIALLWLAKKHLIANTSYLAAKQDFTEVYYPEYLPGEGIQEFLSSIWKDLDIV